MREEADECNEKDDKMKRELITHLSIDYRLQKALPYTSNRVPWGNCTGDGR